MDALKPHKSGYMKPPKAKQFKPGQSGNPAGRPKRIDDPYTTLQKVLARRITVTGETKKMTIQQALFRRLRERAIAGDKRAMALLRKILAMAAALQPVTRVDTTAAKLKLARMLGIAVSDDDQDASDGR
jgi:Family of unknown function (DUF5681)